MKPSDLLDLKLNQSDYVALVPRQRLHSSKLRILLAQTAGETIQEPKLTGCHVEDASILMEHINELEHRLGDSAPKFEFAVSHNHGDNAERPLELSRPASAGFKGGGSAPASESAKKLTPDEEILAARGVKSYAELSQKMASGEIPNPATERKTSR
jgi:hypothetical protein